MFRMIFCRLDQEHQDRVSEMLWYKGITMTKKAKLKREI